jgi:hypothetical protein
MDPFYEHCKRMAVGSGFKSVDSDDIGDVYKTVLHQQGFGYDVEFDFDETYGLGLGSFFSSLFRAAAPILKTGAQAGLKYLGNAAMDTVASIAQDAINGGNIKESAKKHAKGAVDDIFAKAPEIVLNAVQGNKNQNRKRKHVSQPSAGKLVASARKRNRTVYDLDEYPGLHRLL